MNYEELDRRAAVRAPIRLHAAGAGDYVRRALRHHRTATVVATFERSLYLAYGVDGFVCIGAQTIGAGPINIVLREADWGCARTAIHDGAVDIVRDALVFGDELVIELGCAQLWRPQRFVVRATPAAIRSRLAELTTLALEHAPEQGLNVLAFPCARRAGVDGMLTAARPGWAALACWLAESVLAQRWLEPPEQISTLLGLGPGLTPSGDDLLGGVLIALRSLGYERTNDDLWNWLAPQLPGRTSQLSAAHLAAAAQGQGHSALHTVLEALVGAELLDGRTFLDLGKVGHCSGWDALTGATLVLQTLYGAQRATIATASSVA